jgi:hypothetical protein
MSYFSNLVIDNLETAAQCRNSNYSITKYPMSQLPLLNSFELLERLFQLLQWI